jgi:hypothetical protein
LLDEGSHFLELLPDLVPVLLAIESWGDFGEETDLVVGQGVGLRHLGGLGGIKLGAGVGEAVRLRESLSCDKKRLIRVAIKRV